MGLNEVGSATNVGDEEIKPRRIRRVRKATPKNRTPYEQAREAFDQLRLGTEVSLENLISRVEGLRGRRIVIEQRDELGTTKVCGLWLAKDTVELVYHGTPRSELHRQQFILHELAHMVLRHDETVVSADYALTLFPHLNGERVRAALARESFDREDEVVAELLADFFSAAIAGSDREPGRFSEVFG